MNIVTMLKHSMGFVKQSALVLAAGAAVLLGSGTAANAQWSYSAWTGDSDSGIINGGNYTAAVKCNNGSAVTVNGVAFQAYNTTGNFSIGGSVAGPHGPNDPLITGDSKTLAAYFIYGGAPRTVTLSNLTVGQTYETSFFAFGWEGSGRTQTFASGADSLVVDQDAYGNKKGIRISYVFTADATGSRAFTITPYPGGQGTFHMSAFANRSSVPPPLVATLTSPANNRYFRPGSSVSATAMAQGGTPPYTVTYHKRLVGGTYADAGSASTAPYTVSLGTPSDATYEIYATVTDSASPAVTADSATNTFTVGTVMNVDYVETFTSSGTWTAPDGVTSIKLLVVAGGGGAGDNGACGGGGAGGLIYYGTETPAVAPGYLVTPGQTVTVTVGAGGAVHTKGGDSFFGTVQAVGGGYGGIRWNEAGGVGGSGGGASIGGWSSIANGAAGTAGQGNKGGGSYATGQAGAVGGGGGGARTAGGTGISGVAGNGGAGLTYSISGASVTYAGGGGGSQIEAGVNGTGGAGYLNPGGGGMANYPTGTTGGKDGIVIVSYKFGAPLSVSLNSPTNNQAFFTTASVSATALAAGGTPAYTVTYYTNYNGGAFAPAGSTNVALSTWGLGTLAAGTYGIYATATDSASGSATSATNMFTVTVEAPTKWIITAVNGGVSPVAGAPYSVTVTAANAGGTPVNVLENTGVTLSLASGTAGSLGGTLTGTILTGNNSVTISGVINTKAEAVTLQAATSSGASLTAATASYTIVPASAASLTVAGFPSPQSAGAAGSVTVTVKDAYNNLATNYTGTVTLTSSDGAAVLPGSYTFTGADAGAKALFVTLKTIGTQSITATAGALTATQSGISVTAVPPISIFTTPGTSSWTAPSGVTAIQLLVVGGGGGGGGEGSAAGGGGAGGLIYYGSQSPAVSSTYSVTPGQTYTITVGSGGALHTKGGDSSFGTVIAAGGGYGGQRWTGYGGGGGSGGGGSLDGNGGIFARAGGAATPAGQGSASGSAFVDATDWTNFSGGGGGGAGGAGIDGAHAVAGNGGAGLTYAISGLAVAYAGGGGGRTWGDPGVGFTQGSGGAGGGGAAFVAGTDGLGGGGGAGSKGGSGIVIVSIPPPKGTLIILF